MASENEQAAALSRVLEDYAWLVRSLNALLDNAEAAGRHTVRITQMRGVINVCTPPVVDIDRAATPQPPDHDDATGASA